MKTAATHATGLLRPRRRATRGMLLIELLAYLMVMAAVTVLVVDMINLLTQITRESGVRDTMLNRTDGAMDLLRRDVWSAARMTVTENAAGVAKAESAVRLEEPAGTVTWQAAPDGTLTRTATGETAPHVWKSMPAVKFSAAAPALLRVGVDSGPAGRTHEDFLLPSQRASAGGNP